MTYPWISSVFTLTRYLGIFSKVVNFVCEKLIHPQLDVRLALQFTQEILVLELVHRFLFVFDSSVLLSWK